MSVNSFTNDKVKVFNFDQVPYAEGLRLQEEHQQQIADGQNDGHVLVLEHPPTITFGRREKGESLRVQTSRLSEIGVSCHQTKRGGLATFHGPGQIVIYPILNLRKLNLTVRSLVCALEKSMVNTCSHFGIQAMTSTAANRPIGVWVGDRKIGQIGVHISRGISSHGLAFNARPDLSYFDLIHPCGLIGIKPTSIAEELGDQAPPMDEMRSTLTNALLQELSQAARPRR